MTPTNKSISVSLDESTFDTLSKVAEKEDRTITAQARRVLRMWAERLRRYDGELDESKLVDVDLDTLP